MLPRDLSSRRRRARRRLSALILCALVARADAVPPPELSTTLGNVVPFDGFVDELGRPFAVAASDNTAAWVVSPIYTSCPYTCTPITAGLRKALRQSGLAPSEYRVVSFSFDSHETSAGLQSFRDRLSLPQEWSTLRAADPDALARTLGSLDFHTIALPSGQYDHPNLVVILTPDRRVANFLFGVTFEPQSLATALRAARTGLPSAASERLPLLFFSLLGLLISSFGFVSILVRRRKRRSR